MYTHCWTQYCPTHLRPAAIRKQVWKVICFAFSFCPLPALTCFLKWEAFSADLDTQVLLCIALYPFFFCSRWHLASVWTCLILAYWISANVFAVGERGGQRSLVLQRDPSLPSLPHVQGLRQEHPAAQLRRWPRGTSHSWTYTLSKRQHCHTSSSKIFWASPKEEETKLNT